jgi:hypothetical protein
VTTRVPVQEIIKKGVEPIPPSPVKLRSVGPTVGVLAIIDALICEIDTYQRAKANGHTYMEQVNRDIYQSKTFRFLRLISRILPISWGRRTGCAGPRMATPVRDFARCGAKVSLAGGCRPHGTPMTIATTEEARSDRAYRDRRRACVSIPAVAGAARSTHSTSPARSAPLPPIQFQQHHRQATTATPNNKRSHNHQPSRRIRAVKMRALIPLQLRVVGVVIGAVIVTGLASSCGPSSPSQVQSQPCCRILLAFPQGATREAVREGPEPQGTWSPIKDVLGPPSPQSGTRSSSSAFNYDVALAAVMGSALAPAARETHELYANPGARVRGNPFYRHQDSNGRFGGIVALPNVVPVPGNGPLGSSSERSARFIRVSATMAGQDLDVCAVASSLDSMEDQTKWRLYHARRMGLPADQAEGDRWAVGGNTGNIWDDIGLSGAGQADNRGFHDVGCASVTDPVGGAEQLNVCAVTWNGHLVWSARELDGSYSSFADVGKQLGVEDGNFANVSCVGRDGLLYMLATWGQKSGVLGITEDEPTAKFTVHTPNGWRPFIDVRAAASTPPANDLGPVRDVAIGFCNAAVPADPRQAQLTIALLRASNAVTTTVFTQALQVWSPLQPASSWMPRDTVNDPARPNPNSPFSDHATNIYSGISVAEQPFLP